MDFVSIAPAVKKRTNLPTEDYREQNSEPMCNETLHKRKPESPDLDYLAPDVLAFHETTPSVHGKARLTDGLKSMMELIPDHRAEIMSTTAVVNERKWSATVHLSLTGMLDIQRESINALERGRRELAPNPPFGLPWPSARLSYRGLSQWHAERTPPYSQRPSMRRMFLHRYMEQQRLHT